MGKINWGRVVGCGVLTGSAIMAFGVLVYVFRLWVSSGEVMVLGRPFIPPKPGLAFVMLGLQMLLGIVIIWLYACLRPSYGAGSKTAAMAGLAIWFVVSLAEVYLALAGMFPVQSLVLPITAMLIGMPSSAALGAATYRN